MLPDFDRVDRIGSYWGNRRTRAFAELLIDCEDVTLRPVFVAMPREATELPGHWTYREPAPHLEPAV
jgi:hypothetical protein